MTPEGAAEQTALDALRECVHRDILPLETFQQKWDALRSLVIKHRFGSEEFSLLANDINLFPPLVS